MYSTLHRVLRSATDCYIPYSQEERGYETVLESGRSSGRTQGPLVQLFMQWVDNQPIQMSGLTTRSQEDVCPQFLS